jgi:hypothetical protein
MPIDRTIVDRDGTVVSQGAFNHLRADYDRLKKIQAASEALVDASRSVASQCYGFSDGVLKIDYEVITELRKTLADYAVAVSA